MKSWAIKPFLSFRSIDQTFKDLKPLPLPVLSKYNKNLIILWKKNTIKSIESTSRTMLMNNYKISYDYNSQIIWNIELANGC